MPGVAACGGCAFSAGEGAGGASLLLLLAVAAIVLILVLWFELLLRNAAIIILVATSPVGAAGQLVPADRLFLRAGWIAAEAFPARGRRVCRPLSLLRLGRGGRRWLKRDRADLWPRRVRGGLGCGRWCKRDRAGMTGYARHKRPASGCDYARIELTACVWFVGAGSGR